MGNVPLVSSKQIANKSQNRFCGWFRRLKRSTVPPENPKAAGPFKRCGAGVPPAG